MNINKLKVIILNNKWLIASACIVSVLGILLIYLLLIPTPSKILPNQETQFSESPSPTPIDIEKDYSSLNKLIPGKNTINDVKKINGNPDSTSSIGTKTYLIYKTPIESYKNKVAIQNNTVYYSLENVFGDYRGNVESYRSTYGSPDILLFDEKDGYGWDVFLKSGIAIKHDGKDIGAILRFSPLAKNLFMQSIAKEVGLTETPPETISE